MNKKILILSIVAAVLMIMLPISSVVGTHVVKLEKEKQVSSPLFAVQQQSEKKIRSDYLGKGNTLPLFIDQKMTYAHSFDKAVVMLKRNPLFFNKILERIQAHPKILEIMEENDISMTDFESYANAIKNNPALLEQEIKKIEQYLNDHISQLEIDKRRKKERRRKRRDRYC